MPKFLDSFFRIPKKSVLIFEIFYGGMVTGGCRWSGGCRVSRGAPTVSDEERRGARASSFKCGGGSLNRAADWCRRGNTRSSNRAGEKRRPCGAGVRLESGGGVGTRIGRRRKSKRFSSIGLRKSGGTSAGEVGRPDLATGVRREVWSWSRGGWGRGKVAVGRLAGG